MNPSFVLQRHDFIPMIVHNTDLLYYYGHYYFPNTNSWKWYFEVKEESSGALARNRWSIEMRWLQARVRKPMWLPRNARGLRRQRAFSTSWGQGTHEVWVSELKRHICIFRLMRSGKTWDKPTHAHPPVYEYLSFHPSVHLSVIHQSISPLKYNQWELTAQRLGFWDSVFFRWTMSLMHRFRRGKWKSAIYRWEETGEADFFFKICIILP